MSVALPKVPIRVVRDASSGDRWPRIAANQEGEYVLFRDDSEIVGGTRSFARTEPAIGIVVAGDVSEDGRAVVLESSRAGIGAVRVLTNDGSTTYRVDALSRLSFMYDAGAAIRWFDDVRVWILGVDASSLEVAVHLVDLETGADVARTTIPDPFGDAAVSLALGVDRHTCFVNVDAGQHGSVAYRLVVTPGTMEASIQPIVAIESRVHDQVRFAHELEDRSILIVDVDGLVRRVARDGSVLATVSGFKALGGYPSAFQRLSSERVLVTVEGRGHVVMDARDLRPLGATDVRSRPAVSADGTHPVGKPRHVTVVDDEPFESGNPSRVRVVVWEIVDGGRQASSLVGLLRRIFG